MPHSDDLEGVVKGELWVGVVPSGWSPVTWILVREVSRAVKPRGEGLIPSNIKSDETQTPVDSIGFLYFKVGYYYACAN